MKKTESTGDPSASQLIDAKIAGLGDWRGEMLARIRALIQQADPAVVEEWKWNIPVWSLFNSSLDGKVRRAIDFHEGEQWDERALTSLIQSADALNEASARK